MAGVSSPQLSRVTSIVSWKRVGSNHLHRWLAEHEEQAIRALISRHDGKSNERILAVWKLRKTAGKFERGNRTPVARSAKLVWTFRPF